jgi:serpin B
VHRRDLLKLLSLSTLAVAPLLAGCGSESGPGGRSPGGTDVGGGGGDSLELVSADVRRSAGDPAAISEVVSAMHVTGGALYGSLVAGATGNVAISPYSISTALALTTNGAAGKTQDELELVFGGTDVGTVNGGLNALTTHLESLAGDVEKSDGTKTRLDLDAANALFAQRGFTWGEPFLEALARDYGAGVNVVDWGGATEAARKAVNAWTAEQTRDKIPEILPEGSVDGLTRLVLVNTLYLKAPWASPFDKDLTDDGPFTLLDGRQSDVPLMKGYEPVGDAYAEGDGWAAARLSYAGSKVAMTLVLPDAGRFPEVEKDVAERGTASYLGALEGTGVLVTLPSWTFSCHRSLVDPVRALGVELAFGAGDFSPMTTDDDLFIGAIEHEVFIAVDEEGTEAAAATAVVAKAEGAAPSYAELVVDRPFLFVIHDVEHGTPLFLGRVVDPRSA